MRLMSDIMEIAEIKKIGFLVIMGIEKAFDSLDHSLLISTLKNMASVRISSPSY